MYKVLAVDDREIFLLELKRLKVWGEKSGFQIVDTASNGREALELIGKNKYDLILTDIRMPIIDGLQLLREIQNYKLCPCVVFVSEYSEFNYARQGIVLGAFDYIVKSANEETMAELLFRTKSYLDNFYNIEKAKKPDEDLELVYPAADEKQIINFIMDKDENAIKLFSVTTEKIYKALSNNLVKADIITKKLYHSVIKEVYEKFQWLSNYISIEMFEKIDCVDDKNGNNFVIYYCEKLSFLLAFLKKFYLETSDKMIKNITEYILYNYSSDLKLKAIAEKFYINNTYLSNTFAVKTGVKFNDYVTMVKMARAEYLLVNSELKTYEIGYKIGYHDTNYFSKLFKKYYGKNPSDYRNTIDS